MQPPVITRFAPSPTGYLHIGGARTALFNYLFAKRHGGKFLLRIEDTDRARHNQDAVDAIINGLEWLGCSPDEPATSQHECRDRHVEIAHQLLESGHAYRCYLTPEELDDAREKALADKTPFESPWRERTDYPAGKPFAIRFKAPQAGETVLEDAVQGNVTIPNTSLDDMIILRSGDDDKSHNGPTYNLAVVVDDYDMGITHIIRGDDHLINGARQQQIYEALGWPVPVWAHIPLIHGQDGKKLSKRHGALGVEAYRDMGYLADGLANYLLRLGWAHGDQEFFTSEEATSLFELSGINKSPARLDLDKLDHINSHYIRNLSDTDFVTRGMAFLDDAKHSRPDVENALLRGAAFLKERCANLSQFGPAAGFITTRRPLEITGKAAKPLKKDGAQETLLEVINLLKTLEKWDNADDLDAALQTFADAKGVGFGQVGQPVRASLTAGMPSPTLGQVLFALGKEESLSRLDDQI